MPLQVATTAPLTWQKSTYCGSSTCIEVALNQASVAVRDSKETDGPLLWFDRSAWRSFVEAVGRSAELG